MELYVKISLISIVSLFLVLKHDFIRSVDFTRIAASNKQVITSQIMSYIKYLIHIYYILVLIF